MDQVLPPLEASKAPAKGRTEAGEGQGGTGEEEARVTVAGGLGIEWPSYNDQSSLLLSVQLLHHPRHRRYSPPSPHPGNPPIKVDSGRARISGLRPPFNIRLGHTIHTSITDPRSHINHKPPATSAHQTESGELLGRRNGAIEGLPISIKG
jgi:hypothetical protein